MAINVTTNLAMPQREPHFTKTELLSATNLNGRQRDMLMVALEDGRTYTTAEAKAAVEALKGGLF